MRELGILQLGALGCFIPSQCPSGNTKRRSMARFRIDPLEINDFFMKLTRDME